MNRKIAGAGVALVGALIISGTTPAIAATSQDTVSSATVKELVMLNPGTSAGEITQNIKNYAQSQGISEAAAAKAALADARSSAAEAKPALLAKDSTLSLASSSSGGSGTVTLGSAVRKGDIFVSPSSTLFINHGHTGIYYTPSVVVEAPGVGKLSRSIATSTYRVGKGAVKQYIRGTTTQRSKAANLAFNSLRGKAYNTNFAFNKDAYASKMNCSQLVWAAYKRATGIDLDGNGGPGVYPYNIKDSSKTVTYKVL